MVAIVKLMMKKLLGIVFLSLLFSISAYSNEIKHKRIECNNKNAEMRLYNYFFIISNNDKIAKLFKASYLYDYGTYEYQIDLGLNFISIETPQQIEYEINRQNGALWKRGKGIVGTCSKMEDDFNPELYLKEITEKNTKERHEKNIF